MVLAVKWFVENGNMAYPRDRFIIRLNTVYHAIENEY